MKKFHLFFFILLFIVFVESCKNITGTERDVFSKFHKSCEYYRDFDKNPRTIINNEIEFVSPGDWTSGFYPGCLWYAYEITGDTCYLTEAEKHTGLLKNQKDNGTTHDMGFKMFCSYGNGYKITNNKKYKNILLESAKTLATRYNPEVGCVRSWDHHKNQWEYPVIIDNMMNLELLFWAFEQTHDSTYYKIAVSHADKTMKNHFRKDYSSWHVVDYDSVTGKVIKKTTHQGYSDSSAWARGQAWGLYGFTMAYRFTRFKRYLEQAQNIAHYILSNKNLPDDLIPYWDFSLPSYENAPRDASAAAIISSALFELSEYSAENSNYYRTTANKILNNLVKYYQTPGTFPKKYFILDHSTGNYPANSEIDVPIIYADYYFLEAVYRRDTISGKQ